MAFFWPSGSSRASKAQADQGVAVDFQEEERLGLRLATIGQLLVSLLVGAYFFQAGVWAVTGFAFLVALGFALLALVKLVLFSKARYRSWYPFPILVLEAALIIVAIAAPNPFSEDPWPIQMKFRQDNFIFLFLLLGMTAFSYRPRVVLWAGAASALCWWLVSLFIESLPETRGWSDYPTDAPLQELMTAYLTPNFFSWEGRVKEILVLVLMASLLAAAAARARVQVRRNIAARAQGQRLESVFGRFLPETVWRALIADGDGLKPQRREATVMIVDIRSFTEQVRTMAADDVFPMLTAFFEAVEQKVTETGGVLLTYNGDAVVAAFNLPLELDDFRSRAIEAAESVARLTEEERFEGHAIGVRIGIATGPLVAGLVGGSARASYTAYGDAVNLAARLESLNKETGTTILADSRTLEDDSLRNGAECLGARDIRGFADAIEVWSVLPERSAALPQSPEAPVTPELSTPMDVAQTEKR